jgi:ABC-2 type transport system ATP-binding protein
MGRTTINIEKLSRFFNRIHAVNDISFKAQSNEIIGYVGPNGAGKTTTLKMLIGQLRPTSGRIELLGEQLKNNSLLKTKIGYIPESGELYDCLTSHEYLTFIGRIYNISQNIIESKLDYYSALFELDIKSKQWMSSYSKGMKQKVHIISALLHEPQILFLDEPLNGLDVNAIAAFRQVIRQLAENGCTIIYSSHILDVVQTMCNRVIVLNQGRIVADSATEELLLQSGMPRLEDAVRTLLANTTGETDEKR